jgi:dinuclear metal center YbgI/SA1388 family protein
VPRVAELVAFLERLAPPELAEEWDNVGLLLGDRQREARQVLTCLTLTPDVAREAIEKEAGLVVTHHPVLFRPVQRLTADDDQGQMLLALIAAGVAVYSPHTAYDSAAEGINEQLARRLELAQIEALRPLPAGGQCKIVTFVPKAQLAAVQRAVWSAGAGVIGEYSNCSFVTDGTGSFEGSAAANPAVGERGRLEDVAEARLEVVCPERLVPEALRRLREAHPYEEPACDVYPLADQIGRRGSGRMGVLASAEGGSPAHKISLAEFLALVKAKLPVAQLEYVGDLRRSISKVAIACGAGGEFLPAAIGKSCDVLLTGEARFHSCLEARTAGIGLVMAGHYATERPAMETLAAALSREFPQVSAWASEVERDPVHWT